MIPGFQKYLFIALYLLILIRPVCSGAQDLTVELNQIRELSEEYSAEWQQFENRLQYAVHGEQAKTARLNPALSYDLEFLNDGSQSEYEHFLYLEKEFRTPAHYRSLRNLRDRQLEFYREQARGSRAEWLADTRLGFVRIVLMKQELETLDTIENQVNRMISASLRRAEEGEDAAIDHQLLEMSSYQLQARIGERAIEKDHFTAMWRTRMGFDEAVEITFSGRFDTPAAAPPPASGLVDLLDETPRARAERYAVESAGFGAELERNRRLPSFGLSAGYKQLHPGWHGFLVGISVPVPILSSNSEAIAQARAREQIEKTGLDLAQMERNRITLQLLSALNRYEQNIEKFPAYMENPESLLQTLSASYEEGTRSISDILNTLNLLADTYQARFDQLRNYYEAAMELEAITGQPIVR